MNRIANNPDYDRLGFGRSPNEAAGAYSRQFLDRARAAVFHKAYGDEALTAMSAESADPEIKNILNALSLAAPNFGYPEFLVDKMPKM
ncbi:MAG: hypothetical protein WCX93_00270 [Burkholderiaceae bacterium]